MLKPFCRSQIFLVSLITAALHSGCGVLVGNVKPTTEHDEQYHLMDIAAEEPGWKLLSPPSSSSDESHSDVAYQSEKTASIISLTSACGKGPETESNDLKHYTDLLLMGFNSTESKTERALQLGRQDALETTVEGTMNHEPTRVRTVVLKKDLCVYDLMYISRPVNFSVHENLFSRFVNSFRPR